MLFFVFSFHFSIRNSIQILSFFFFVKTNKPLYSFLVKKKKKKKQKCVLIFYFQTHLFEYWKWKFECKYQPNPDSNPAPTHCRHNPNTTLPTATQIQLGKSFMLLWWVFGYRSCVDFSFTQKPILGLEINAVIVEELEPKSQPNLTF